MLCCICFQYGFGVCCYGTASWFGVKNNRRYTVIVVKMEKKNI